MKIKNQIILFSFPKVELTSNYTTFLNIAYNLNFPKFNHKIFVLVSVTRSMSKVNTETDAEFDARYEAYFSRPSIDGWEVRKVRF